MPASSHLRIGGVTIVVVMATMTISVKIGWLRMPTVSPIVATTTSVEPRAFMPKASAAASRDVSPPRRPPRNPPSSLPAQATATNPPASASSRVSPRIRRSIERPASVKKTGAKSATIGPRSCSSRRRDSSGDCPTRMPPTNAPSEVWTPMASVSSAMAHMKTRISVMTAKSLRVLSLVQRIARATRRRPTVKASARKASVPITVVPAARASKLPREATPASAPTVIQPTVSSTTAVARMSWPRFRRWKPESRMIMATIFTDDTARQVATNSAVSSRRLGSGSTASGRSWATRKPAANGKSIPHADEKNAVRRMRCSSRRSVSMPLSSSRSSTPNCDMPSTIAFCSGVPGKIAR